ncbi:MAG: hypothetical protein OEV42_18500 [Deltaproteobacteria bacterium]|nr:hypothetical protein [Deltaproteobacteria bacterium]
MKRLAAIIMGAVLLAGTIATADVPGTINYQGKLTDSVGSPVTATPNITFSIYSTSSGGGAIWSETQNSVSVSNGIFSVQLGSVTPIDNTKLPQADLWLGVNVAGDGEMTPRQKLANTPFAVKAGTIDSAGSVDDGALSANVTKLGSTINVTELANGTAGQLITWSAASAPTTVAAGTSGQVLTSNGAGAAPTFQAAAAGGGGKAVYGGGGGTVTNTTLYFSPNGTTGGEPTYQYLRLVIVPFNCTAKNLYFHVIPWTAGQSGSHVVTLMKGTTGGTSSATSLTCSASANVGVAETVSSCSDTSNTDNVLAGNWLTLRVASTGSGSATVGYGFTCE